MDTQTKIPNKLINEKSPYLLQHAYNPVDWMPWGEEAFKKAKEENKPVFLSIGYSTCHWCHIMAHETFEDFGAADILNKHFISVKVDREERPDIDNVYMAACQAYTGLGGWPLSIFIDCEKQPFFAGTYFPKETFVSVLHRINNLWETERERLVSQAKRIVNFINNEEKVVKYAPVEDATEILIKYFKEHFDQNYGGFSKAPKFPSPHNLLFLLEYHKIFNDADSLKMCEKTLRYMRNGGIYDHVGGGFSRYSTDNIWLVPHFEKMLYDNALLTFAYLKCYEMTKNTFYLNIAKEIITYLMRDMKSPEGAFYTAEDADSEGYEGLFYTFTFDEINDILKEDAIRFCARFDISKAGNFESRNIINTIGGKGSENVEFKKSLKKLFDYRGKRKRPHRDEKILLAFNGLMLAALSLAGRICKEENYINAAKKIVEFIDKNLTSKDGKLISFYLNGPGKHSGFAEDYAFYIWGLLELNQAAPDCGFLNKAVELQDKFAESFFDKDAGGFYLSDINAEQLIARAKELYDGATPSYNSVTLNNLLELYNLTKDVKYLEQLSKTLIFFSDDLSKFPQSYAYSVLALMKLQKQLPGIHICYNSVCRPPAKNLSEFINIFK